MEYLLGRLIIPIILILKGISYMKQGFSPVEIYVEVNPLKRGCLAGFQFFHNQTHKKSKLLVIDWFIVKELAHMAKVLISF
jgi:hypothetical protein